MTSTASIVCTIRREPVGRLVRLINTARRQLQGRGVELVIAAPPNEIETVLNVIRQTGFELARAVPNPSGRRSPGLNRAVRTSTGAIVCRLDARSVAPDDYVERCIARLDSDSRVGVVGGQQRPIPARNTTIARGISRALSNPIPLGAAAYRRPSRSGPTDTVYLGAFRRTQLLDLGGFDEALDANEDFDLCARYRAVGCAVWLESGLAIDYEARDTIRQLWSQYRQFGRAKTRYWLRRRARPNARQVTALGLAAGAMVAVGLIAAKRPSALRRLPASWAAMCVVVDLAGRLPAAPAAERLASMACYNVIVGGWLTGVVTGLAEALASSISDRSDLRETGASLGLARGDEELFGAEVTQP